MIFGTIEGWGEDQNFFEGIACSHAKKKLNTEKFITNALDAGFSQFDASPLYHNEKEVGDVLKKYNVRVISKLPEFSYGYEKVIHEFEKSSKNLNITDYLIHWPSFPLSDLDSTWKGFEYLKKKFNIRIGVCNFDIVHLKKLLDVAEVKPEINQFECNVFLQNNELIQFCKFNNIEIQSYGSIFRGRSNLTVEDMIGWLLNQNINPIVSSRYYDRLIRLKECKKHKKNMTDLNTNTRLLMNPNLYCNWT